MIKVINLTTGDIYKSTVDAAISCDGDASTISKVCRGERSTHKGFEWAFYKEEDIKVVKKPTAYVFIPDLHMPATDWDLISQMRQWCDDLELDYDVKYYQLGDWLDGKAWGRWEKAPDDDGPQTEFDKAWHGMERLHKMFPKMTLICGNHCLRPLLRASEAGLPSQLLKTIDDIFPFDGWTWHLDSEPLYIKELDCYILHGDEMGGTAEQKSKNLGSSVIQGHSHKGRLTYLNRARKQQTFAMEAGCIIDSKHKAFRYSARNPLNSFLGFGVVIDGVPSLVPLG